MFKKKQKKVSCQICNTWFHKKCTQLSGKDFKSISFRKNSCLCQSCFRDYVPFESPKNNKNLKAYSHMNIIITPRSAKTNFYNNCNSMEFYLHKSSSCSFETNENESAAAAMNLSFLP